MRFCIRIIAAVSIGLMLLCFGIPCCAYDASPQDALSDAAQSVRF